MERRELCYAVRVGLWKSRGSSALWLRGMLGLASELEWSVISAKTDR